ncbi:xanthine dehydrogenase accessory protein XdhC [Palleronia sp. KMU-117]|uniref:xanthine dehydrogenase accessory protein XdhC n=1 Tax=Palleronia sp. KMU-117 TaxID=3434108 RepID=UPI003D72C84A
MSFDTDTLAATIAREGRVARVVVAGVEGSAPREVGAAMLVWPGGQSGTIGGGALEHEAAARARAVLATGSDRLDRLPLGPALGQCCGGGVTLLTEVWDAARLGPATGEAIARPLPGPATAMPLAVRRLLNAARAQGKAPGPGIVAGWMVEPRQRPARALWLYGAGHVGRAIVDVLAPLPEIAITWVDTAPDRFPDAIPPRVTRLVAVAPAEVVRYAPHEAEHLVMTYSHALDLELCHRLLHHGFRRAGLIGSKTKWARFRSRLRQLGHEDAQIARIACPIGDPSLGKHPQAIAVGVAAALLKDQRTESAEKDATG